MTSNTQPNNPCVPYSSIAELPQERHGGTVLIQYDVLRLDLDNDTPIGETHALLSNLVMPCGKLTTHGAHKHGDHLCPGHSVEQQFPVPAIPVENIDDHLFVESAMTFTLVELTLDMTTSLVRVNTLTRIAC